MVNQIALCRYHYDPLDRLASRTLLARAVMQQFYNATQLATELQGGEQRSFLRTGDQLLAQQSQTGKVLSNALIVTDQQRSVLNAVTPAARHSIAYSAYGHRPIPAVLPGLPGFNGEQPDPLTGHYLLGNGYRAYNPVLMRFNRPDSLSPFGEGGLNPYAYCVGDPVNRRDPTGHKANRRQILGFVWVGLGFAGALWGLKVAIPTVKAVLKGGASVSQKLAAAGAVGQVVASTAFTASRITAAVAPDSPVAEGLMWGALAMGIPSFAARVSSHYVAQAVAKKVAIKSDITEAIKSTATPRAAITKAGLDNSVRRRSSGTSIRSGNVGDTRL